MKKKQIEKISWMAKKKGKQIIAKAEIVTIGNEKTLIVDITMKVPVVRISMTKKDFASFIPQGSPLNSDNQSDLWSLKCIENLQLYQYLGITDLRLDTDSEKIIRNFTENNYSDWMDCIQKIQESISTNKRRGPEERREKRRWQSIEARMKTVPRTPKGFEEWAKAMVEHHHISILPFMGNKTTRGICSACGKESEFVKGKVKVNQIVECEHCGEKTSIKRVDWKKRNPLPVREYAQEVILLQRTSEGFVKRHFVAWKDVEVDKEKGGVFEKGRVFRINRNNYTYFLKVGWSNTFWDDRNLSGLNNIILKNGPLYPLNIFKSTFQDTPYQYSALEIIKNESGLDPITYLAKYEKIPQIEMMVKSGLKRLALEIDESNINKDMKPWEQLGIEKSQLNRLREINGGKVALMWFLYEKQKGSQIENRIIQWFEKESILPKEILFVADKMSEVQIHNYVIRQMRESGATSKEVLSTWEDYLAMAERLSIDTNDSIVFKVRKLRQRHDELVKRIGDKDSAVFAGKMAKKYPDVDAICRGIKEKYEYHDKQYTILVPEQIEDIIREGAALQHCINKSEIYFDRINSRESYIVFLRKADAIKTSWYTLEIEPDGTVRQKRTEFDRQKSDIKEARAFIRKWQREISKRLDQEDQALASKSKILRVEEFKELRLKNVKIWHGDLAGQLLADVLEADLMEVPDEEGKVRCG